MTDSNRVPIRSDRPVSEVDERGDTVLYDQAGGRLLVLNDVGAGVWTLIDGQRSVVEIAQLVVEHLPAEREQVEDDVAAFIDTLREQNLVDWRP